MDISVVIISWNAKSYLEECLQSLANDLSNPSLEIIVVDNASSDGSPEMVELEFPEVKLIRNSQNLGFAAANNLAIRISTGRYIALVNSDVRVLAGCLTKLQSYMERNPKVGVVGPRVLNTDLTLQSSCRTFPSLWNNFCECLGLSRVFKKTKFFSGEHMFYFKHDVTRDVDALVGCFWLVRRDAMNDVGLLDEDYFIYAEDVDWCKRCWDAGWRVAFYPEAQAIHHRAGSSANDPARFAVEQQRAVLRYWQKHHGFFGQTGIRCILLGYHLLRYTYGKFRNLLQDSVEKKRLLISGACLHALVSKSKPAKA